MMHANSRKYSCLRHKDIAQLRRQIEKITARSGANATRKLAQLKAAIDRLEDKISRRLPAPDERQQ